MSSLIPNRAANFLAFLVNIPRTIKIIVMVALALGVTFGVFPLTAFLVRWAGSTRPEADIYNRYVFDLGQPLSSVYVGVSVAVAMLYYIWGWRIFIGTVGEPVPARPRILSMLLVGGFFTVWGLVWLSRGGVVFG
jgi:hypothetical protein